MFLRDQKGHVPEKIEGGHFQVLKVSEGSCTLQYQLPISSQYTPAFPPIARAIGKYKVNPSLTY